MADIVVIDSEPTVRSVVTSILERGGYSVWSTGEFDKALEKLRGETANLVLTNVFLRGITGHDAMCELRSEFPLLRVLMVSGLPDEKAIQAWTNESRFDVFPKPFTSDSLLEKVRQVLTPADGGQPGAH